MDKEVRIDAVDRKILKALRGTNLTTPHIASTIKISKGQAYGRCRKLEENGLLASTLEGAQRLYCVDCQDVVTRERYKTCQAEDHDLRSFSVQVRNWTITEAGRKAL